jgi:apolipoprotein N-acyltransferase
VIPLVISGIIYVTYEPEGRAIEVGVIQPNYEPHYEKFEVSRRKQQERFISLARSILTPETRILVFPETIFGGFDINDVEVQPEIRAFRALLDSFPNCAIIMGLDPYRFLEPGEDSPAKRTYTRSAPDTLYWEAYNLALMLRPNEPTETYLKGKLVPGAEIFPYRHLLFFMEPLVNQLDGSLEGLRRSIERKVFRHEGAAVGPVICYESVFGDYCTGYVRKGANVLAIITNDGWWDETPGHLQHLKLGALRAIETRRDIIRSANTGISCFIDQRGDINQATAYEETKAFTGAVRLNEKITFYTKWGDFIGRISFFMAILIISYGIVVPWRRKWHL